MGTRRSRLRSDDGFTLVELIIGMAITGLIVVAIASALVVSFRTTDVTQQRMAESHDVLISSAYLANDVQSAASLQPGSGGNCSGSSTTLVTFAYSSGPAVYACGTSGGETQVTRTFGGSSVVLAHFAAAARPTVRCSPNTDCSGQVSSVAMAFTEASGFTHTLVGSRRAYGSSGGGGGGSTTADVTVLSTGSSSPLWVQGGCLNPGTNGACSIDPTSTAVPISDVATAGWTPTPASPTTLWDKLSDQSDSTWAATSTNQQARVALATGLLPPEPLFNPFVELRASSVGGGQQKLTIYLYHGTTVSPFATIGPTTIRNPIDDYELPVPGLGPTSVYSDLRLGFAMTSAGNGGSITVYGTALDTAKPAGLLTIRGSLYVNSQSAEAVRLTGGTKSGSLKMTISPGDFRIWSPGACSGCNRTTVSCPGCTWSGQQPWTSYSTSLLDPLRSLPAPPVPSSGGCSGSVCSPGRYTATLSRTTATTLQPGIYYLEQGLSLSGDASVTCPSCTSGAGVLLYIAGGSVSFTGRSTIDVPAAGSGTYKDIVMFQARSLSSPVKVAGNAGSSIPIRLDGIVYVPNSTQVTLATGTATFSAKAIVAQNIKVSSPVTIG